VTALGAAGLPGAAAASPATSAPAYPHHGAQPAAAAGDEPFQFLTAPEVAFIEAALAVLIPTDELGPGAREAGVANFIDRQLAGAFGTQARGYRQGPWAEGSPEQGFQSALTPQQIYRVAIADINRHCSAEFGSVFNELDASRREDVLTRLEAGSIALETVPAPLFFGLLWTNTQEGFFADPMYGGNRGKAGWALVGFPGVAAAYIEEIGKHNVPYRVDPVSIGDIQRGQAPVDAHGHPVHARNKSGA
jgi:gluconate 2-dehydrogenase gamma chain